MTHASMKSNLPPSKPFLQTRIKIGSFSIDDGDGSENVTINLELVSWGPSSSLERERKIRSRLFRSSIKREIRHFHVVVV